MIMIDVKHLISWIKFDQIQILSKNLDLEK